MANRPHGPDERDGDLRQFVSEEIARQFSKQAPEIERRIIEIVAKATGDTLKRKFIEIDERLKAVETRTPGEGV